MTINRTVFTFAATAVLATVALAAPSPVGIWKGHIKLNMPANATPQQAAASTSMIAKIAITMILRKDHTWSSTISGMPAAANRAPKQQSGTWSTAGNIVSLRDPKQPKNPQKFHPLRQRQNDAWRPRSREDHIHQINDLSLLRRSFGVNTRVNCSCRRREFLANLQ